ncbi:MAG: hypothetical protein E6Q92_04395 [Burkholderiaceae bacterium]|nr:MAG: hypothetical protein E6Q92_04395 [Burkholderiaceae bacterium]
MRRTIEHAEQLAAKLRALPAVENKTREISKQEEVRLLAADIQALIRERNWTIQQVAEYLTAEGLEIGAPTLKSYLQRSKANSKKPSGKRKTAATSTPTDRTPHASRTQEGVASAPTIGERAAAALSQTPSNTSSATAAITRPDRQQL